MRRLGYQVSLALAAAAALSASADVREGLVAYWPMDAVAPDGFTTPDLVAGNNLVLYNMDASSLVPGQHGQAFSFDGFVQLLALRVPAGVDIGLPVSRSPQYTIACWVKGLATDGTGAVMNSDRRVFSESSSQQNNSLVNIGTHNTGADNTVDIFIRNAGGTALVNHYHSPGVAFDDTWRHVALVNDNGACRVYIDGVENGTVNYTGAPFQVDIVSVGAILRGAEGADAYAAFFPGAVDELGLWERVLTVEEINEVKNNRVQTPIPSFPAQFTQHPQGRDDLLVGKPFSLTASASGSRPFAFQWFKGDQPLDGQTSQTLTFDALQLSDSGTYTVRVSNAAGPVTSEPAVLVVNSQPPPDLKRELVAYWPLNEVEGTKTPDYVSGYDMTLNNLTPADVVTGKVGNAFSFSNTRQTLLSYVSAPGDQIPINQHPAASVAFWAQVDGPGFIDGVPKVDLRLFSEGNTLNGNPLFNLGTHNTGADGSVDLFFRQTAGGDNLGTVNHVHTIGQPFDGTWHHVVFTQDETGARAIYIDGVRDELAIDPKPPGNWALNTTTIGGILRASPSHWVTGLIDEVALWKRELFPEEVTQLFTQGLPAIDRYQEPLAVRSFAADFAAVVNGEKVTLRWDVAKFATVTITPGVGDVTAQTQFGVGSAEATVNGTTTFTITVSREGQSVTDTLTVKALDGVAAGWRLLDNFEQLTAGPVVGQGNWKSPDGVANVIQRKDNKVLGYDGGQDLAALDLKSLTLKQGEKATVFFRFHALENDNTVLGLNVGLTDKPIRFIGDFAGDVGPYFRLDRLVDDPAINPMARNGFGAAYDFSGSGYTLQAGKTYRFWIDVQNNDIAAGGDTYSVYVQAEDEAARTTLFENYVEDRNPAGSQDLGLPKPDLGHLLAAAIEAGQGVGTVFVDDFFLSTTGAFNSTTPVPASSFEEGGVTEPPKGNIVWVSFHSAEATPTAAAVTAGFTEAPDAAYTRLLADNNYTVTRYVTTATPDPAAFAEADLVIVGRSVPSGHYQNAGATAWNSIEKPIMVMGGYTIRNSRMGFTTGGTIPDTGGAVRLTVANPAHPVFEGVALDAQNTMVNTFADLANFNGTVQRGISVNTDPLAGGGTLLASIGTAGDPAVNGMVIGEWFAGATMGNGTADTLAGHRLVFLSGSREHNGLTSEGAGIYDLSADGATLFLNAVDYMVNYVPPAIVVAPLAPGGALGDVGALANVVHDTVAKTITADLPADQSKPAYLTITPAVNITSVKIEGGKLVITYQ